MVSDQAGRFIGRLDRRQFRRRYPDLFPALDELSRTLWGDEENRPVERLMVELFLFVFCLCLTGKVEEDDGRKLEPDEVECAIRRMVAARHRFPGEDRMYELEKLYFQAECQLDDKKDIFPSAIAKVYSRLKTDRRN